MPGEDGAFLINPFGLMYDEVTASNLVKIDINGIVLDDPLGGGINGAGFVIHGAVHAARHDLACVVHTHTRAGVAVSAQKSGLLPLSQHAAMLCGRIGYHDFEGIAMRLDEQERLVANLGSHDVLILRNHGLLVAGPTLEAAFSRLVVLERACEIQIATQACGDLNLITKQSVDETQAIIDSAAVDHTIEWRAMERMIDRVTAGAYRH